MNFKEYLLNNHIDELFSTLSNKKVKDLDSYTIFSLINIAYINPKYEDILENNIDCIINQICYNFNLYDCLSLLLLKKQPKFRDKVNPIYDKCIKSVFCKETVFFLIKLLDELEKADYIEESITYNILFDQLSKLDNNKSSKILYNLFLLLDFREILKQRYSVVELMIDKYQKFDPNTVAEKLFVGSSILGCLLKGKNQYIAESYFNLLKNDKKCKDKNIKMIGGGSTCLVYKIGDSVLKLGETRNSRKVCIDFRILASKIRKLIVENGNELFYVEVMKYIKTGDVTKEECEELKKDLLRRGIIWEDAKPENCGILGNNDQNICELNMDDVLIETDANAEREEFMKKKRKVVVLDNDNMRLSNIGLWNQKRRS